MREDLAIERLRDEIRRQGEMPAKALINSLVERGVIDRNGRVLIRMPIGRRPSSGHVHKAKTPPSTAKVVRKKGKG